MGDYLLEVTVVKTRSVPGSDDWFYSYYEIRAETMTMSPSIRNTPSENESHSPSSKPTENKSYNPSAAPSKKRDDYQHLGGGGRASETQSPSPSSLVLSNEPSNS